MSIGSVEGVDRAYLKRLKGLIDRIDPFIVSDHLCWTGPRASNIHDLLPLPHTAEAVDSVSAQIDVAQSALGRPLVLENVSSYLNYKESEFSECEFLLRVARKSGCRLLVDVNNVYVNSANHGFDPAAYIDEIPADLIAQIHLAGFSDMGDYLFDTHSHAVSNPVWKLFSRLIKRAPRVPFMIEWDENVPAFETLQAQAQKACRVWEEHHGVGTKTPSSALR